MGPQELFLSPHSHSFLVNHEPLTSSAFSLLVYRHRMLIEEGRRWSGTN
jgi:hypothetical protein